MKGLPPFAAHSPDVALRFLQAVVFWQWLHAQTALAAGAAGGDGSTHAAGLGAPHVHALTSLPVPDTAWRDRSEALQSEARAALRAPFSKPPTWAVC